MPNALTSEELRADLGYQLEDASPLQMLQRHSLSKLPLHRVIRQTIHEKNHIQSGQTTRTQPALRRFDKAYLFADTLPCYSTQMTIFITLQISS
jgi:hypothetical protein